MNHLARAFRSLPATVALCVAVSSSTPMLAQSAALPPVSVKPENRIMQVADDQNLTRLSGNTSALARIGSDLGVAAENFPLQHLQLVLKRSDAQEAALQQLLKDQQNPSSSNYHQWLSPEEYGAAYGVSNQDLSTITTWLTSHGFSVEGVSKSRMVITISGTQREIRSAFHTEIHQYNLHNQTYFGNASDPLLPVALVPVVKGFATLSNYGPKPLHTSPQLMKHTASSGWQKSNAKVLPQSALGQKPRPDFTVTNGTSHSYIVSPSDFATIYNVAPLWKQGIDGTGQTIAIVAASDINPADVDAFRKTFGLPTKKLNFFYVDQNPGLTGDSTEAEAVLDVEWAGAMAKNATIDIVISVNGPLAASQYAIDNNLAPILSVSWGECEMNLGASGNQYINNMWQQAAAQGITVLVAAGDSGSASCDQGQELSYDGEQVSGFASTPYNTAVGGTDFSGNYPHAAPYWNLTNYSATLASAISYIPETPWNESCGSPQVLAAAQANGFAADKTTEALCNDFTSGFIDTAGGGGGISRCTDSDGSTPSTCIGGYPTPDWQLMMPGMPKNGKRNLPDISFFAGSGIWGSSYAFCQSDATPDGACNYLGGDAQYLVAGGTSFASPAFAGVVALMNQQSKSQIGNINYLLYQVGAAQYNGTGAAPFHDITAGTIAMPCLAGNPGVPPTGLCTVSVPADVVGILPDFSANVGYDMASGLGSADVTALSSAWSAIVSGLAASKTTLTLTGPATATYGTPISVKVQVSAASGTSVPTGGASALYDTTASGVPLAAGQLTNGTVNLSGKTMPAGQHNLVGHYPGDGTFAASTSVAIPVTVTQAVTTMTLTSSRTTVATSQSVSFQVKLETASTANSPTGTLTFTDVTTGKVLGNVAIEAQTDDAGNSTGYGFLNVAGYLLGNGTNAIKVTYLGDGNYTGSTAGTSITYTSAFQVTLGQTAMTMPVGAQASTPIPVTVTPGAGTALNIANMEFSCPATLPSYLTCKFSAPTLNSNGTVSSNLTILASSPLAGVTKPSLPGELVGGITTLACIFLLGIPGRKRSYRLLAVVCSVGMLFFVSGCGSSPVTATPNNAVTNTTLSTSSATPSLSSPLTLSAQVASTTGSGTPTGSVTFLNGVNVLGVATLSNGTATFTTAALTVGPQTLTASYAGDTTFSSSSSTAAQVDVTLVAPVTIQVSDNAGDLATQTLFITVK